MSYQNQSKKPNLKITFALCFFFVFIAFILILNKQRILDVVSYWQYKPTTEMASIINRAGVNDNGRFLFYASQPKLDGTQDFNSECDLKENVTSILGCYNENRIYLYDVTDSQLDGIKEVTAAHEMLHVAYARLDDAQKVKVDSLEEAEYTKLENDTAFQEIMKYYEQTEPGQRNNELHSIIATQVSNVGSELETYYSKYFSNRQLVVALYSKYIGVFTRLDDQAKSLSTQLGSLSTSINSEVATYNSDILTLNSDIQDSNFRAANNQFNTLADFYSERSSLSGRVSVLNTHKNSINADITQYNALLVEYNSIASASKTLYNSIDSTLAPAPSV